MRDIQPALFVEAKQRGTHEAFAKPHAFQQCGKLPSQISPPRWESASP
jgi:hypothetical protein